MTERTKVSPRKFFVRPVRLQPKGCRPTRVAQFPQGSPPNSKGGPELTVSPAAKTKVETSTILAPAVANERAAEILDHVVAAPMTTTILVANIDAGVPSRPINLEHVAILAYAFQEIGQTTPISVFPKADGRWGMLEGWHRLEATLTLGSPTIWAQIVDRADVELRQVQISQNLHRKGLMALEQAISDAEWIETVRQKAAQVADPMGGRQPSEKGYSKAARELGLTPERMARSSLINSIPSEIQVLIRERGLDDNQSALIKIAKTDASAQRQAVLELAERQSRRSPKSGRRVATPPKDEDPNRGAGTPAVSVLRLEQNQTKPDTPEVTLDSEPDKCTLSIGGPSISVPERPAHNEPATSSQHALSKAQAFVDFPALPEYLKRADVETELKKLTEEYLGSRLHKIVIGAPYKAVERFINEVFLPDFQKASQEALAAAGDGGQP